jgi:alkyldihydroxyacetonephosphate synthase
MGLPIIKTLTDKIGAAKVRTDDATLQERRHDYWVMSYLDDIQGRPAPKPACVVQPDSVDDVVAVVNACREGGVALIPFGLGSGVCGGIISHPDKVLLDMSTMNRTRYINEANLMASFEAGKNGGEANREVEKQGLIIGHWPQSVDVSSVGGWVSTRASGQFSTGYGNIEDVVHSYDAVLPNGEIFHAGKAPRASAGPDLRHILMGAEGTMGVITGVTFALRRAPERRAHMAFHAKTMEAGLEAQRVIVQSGWLPVVMRQYDAVEAKRNFPDHANEDESLLIMIHEGPDSKVEAELAGVREIAGIMDLAPANEEVVAEWFEERNQVRSWDYYIERGIILDTIEVSAPWDKIGGIYRDVVQAIPPDPETGILGASGHSSHVYRTGVNLYFTFAAIPKDPQAMSGIYHECWRRVMEATSAGGGGIAHHHGIGRLRKSYLPLDLGDGGSGLLRSLKQALDPTGFMNPGVLIPDA